ncbi:MAG: hypothetical protein ACREQO_11240 [Candidatus Binatia bacterium]
MAISQQDYQLKSGETIDAYNTRIASLRAADTTSSPTSATPASAPTGTQNQTVQVNAALGGNYFDTTTGAPIKPFAPASIPNPAPAPSPTTAGTSAPTLPTPTAPQVNQTSITTLQGQVDSSRQQLESAYSTQLADIKAQQQASQAKIDQFTANQKDALSNMQDLSAPFRSQLEAQKEQELYVTQNFQANQNLTNELDSLLTEGNQLIAQQKGMAAPSSILNAKVNKTIADVNARAGVIQAVMAARNNQISQAYTMIDRAVSAMTADRQDQLNYYKTVYDFYDKQKDTEGQKLVQLTSDQKDYISKQIGLLESDLTRTQKNADTIKQAMLDPNTAQAYGQAGVTLNDSPEQIAQKLSRYGYAKELSSTSNDMAQKGYSAVLPGQPTPQASQILTVTDSKGVQHQYYKAPDSSGTGQTVSVPGPSGQTVSVPLDVAPYYDVSNSGISYIDASTLQGTAEQKKKIVDEAQAAGIKVILNKNVAADISNIKDANNKLDTLSSVFSNLSQPGPLSQALYGIGLTKLATLAQTDPQKAAAESLQSVGLDMLKAISGVQGFRGNATVVQQINDHLPTIYDTQAVAQQKIDYIRQLISDREDGLLGKSNSSVDLSSFENGNSGTTVSNGVDLSQFAQ